MTQTYAWPVPGSLPIVCQLHEQLTIIMMVRQLKRILHRQREPAMIQVWLP